MISRRLISVRAHVPPAQYLYDYGVATISSLLKIIGLFCKKSLQKRLYSAKETYNLKEPTKRSHPHSRRRFSAQIYDYYKYMIITNIWLSQIYDYPTD